MRLLYLVCKTAALESGAQLGRASSWHDLGPSVTFLASETFFLHLDFDEELSASVSLKNLVRRRHGACDRVVGLLVRRMGFHVQHGPLSLGCVSLSFKGPRRSR